MLAFCGICVQRKNEHHRVFETEIFFRQKFFVRAKGGMDEFKFASPIDTAINLQLIYY